MRLAKITLGFALLTGGIAMLALPGPGWLTIMAGLALLAAEFPWARRALDRLKRVMVSGRDRLGGGASHGSEVTQANRSSRE